uniref:NADH dehydrogenase [ubiquinone] flavoprotein 3, mitochondrial n=1 Tax=Esox lucius TaxID=8010 RepID=A0AAY5K3Z8_ESOLU
MGTPSTSRSCTEDNKESTKMATSLLRLGHLKHLKVLQRDGWGLFKSSAAPFCTKAQEPTKAVKKAKAASYTHASALSPEPPCVFPPSETAAEPPVPAPEPFDNTTYKNLQHHNYNHYTFADMDLEMAKYRLPQPSSGRPSPRH